MAETQTQDRADKIFNAGDSIAAEAELEVIRAERAARRKGGARALVKDNVKEDEGIDFDATDNADIDHGYILEPFNMRRETQEGKFDEEGNYERDVEMEKQVTDQWLDQVDEGAKEATFGSVQQRSLAFSRFNTRLTRWEDSEALMKELTDFLHASETPREALMRLSGARKEAAGTSVRSAPKLPWEKRKAKAAEEKKVEPKAKVKKPRRKLTEWGYEPLEGEEAAASPGKENGGDANSPETASAAGTKRPAPAGSGDAKRAKTEDGGTTSFIDRVTEICDQLMQQGYFDVFTTAKEKIPGLEKAVPDAAPDQEEDDDDEEKLTKEKQEADFLNGLAQQDAALIQAEQAAQAAEEEGEGASLLDMLGDLDDPMGDVQATTDMWQYKWTEEGETYGPFPTQQIYAWRGAGVFGADGVLARRVDAEGKPLDTEWTRLKADPPVNGVAA
jgi:hypothetical protein